MITLNFHFVLFCLISLFKESITMSFGFNQIYNHETAETRKQP